MAGKQPSSSDRLIAHALVGIGAGALAGQKAGFPGFIVGAIVGVVVHEVFDAPLAAAIADIM
jgi:hypothetical protein